MQPYPLEAYGNAKYIAENQNASPRYDCTLIKEDKSDIADEEITIRPLDF